MDWRLVLLAVGLWVAIGYLLWEMRDTPGARDDHPPRAGRYGVFTYDHERDEDREP